MSPPLPSNPSLDALRAEVRAIENVGRSAGGEPLPFEVEEIDRRLAGGGIAISALHEAAGTKPALSDDTASVLFFAGIAARRLGTVLWASFHRDLFAPGLAQAGVPPSRLIFADCRNDEEVLAVMEEGLRHGGPSTVVGEVGRAVMASTRRLQLAAEEGGATALLLRRWRKDEEDPLATPSAAMTRWRIGCAPSGELPVRSEGIGRARWRIELVRQRGGAPHTWIMEGSDAEGRLALPTELINRSAAADRGGEVRAA